MVPTPESITRANTGRPAPLDRDDLHSQQTARRPSRPTPRLSAPRYFLTGGKPANIFLTAFLTR